MLLGDGVAVSVANRPTVFTKLRLDGVKHQRAVALHDEGIRRKRCGVLRHEEALREAADFFRDVDLVARGFEGAPDVPAPPSARRPRPPKPRPGDEPFVDAISWRPSR